MATITAEKFKPTLFIGLGGNGGKIVNILAGKLRRHPNWSRIDQLTHFIAIDTNKDDLDKATKIPAENRYLVSAFDRQAYVASKRGEAHLDADPLVTQWIPTWYRFRSAQGAGAGQIRLESRLGLYYNLENDRALIRKKLQNVLMTATKRENPWRDEKDKVVQVVLYASVAGGTGSGGFLPMAYLLDDIIRDYGWGRGQIVGVLSLPTTFLDKVKPELQDDISANGYAALKELEHLNRQLGYQSGADTLEFHYDPGNAHRTRVRHRPFNLVYLIDRPSEISIDRYEHAVADASFLQIYSPLLGQQAGEYDNYDKRQQALAQGFFSTNFASFGVSLLRFPRRDVVRYASLRYVARAFRDYLCFGGDDPDFRVPYGDPAFERKDQREKDKIADEKFEGYVAAQANLEQQIDEKGFFSAVHGQIGATGKPLDVAFKEVLSGVFGKLSELIDLPSFPEANVQEASPSMTPALDALRRDYAASRTKVRTYLEAQVSEVRTGRTLSKFFGDEKVNPVAQRLFLVKLFREAFIVPFADPEEGGFLSAEGGGFDLDSEATKREVERLNKRLGETANRGFLKSMLSSENTEFMAAKRQAKLSFEQMVDGAREELQRYFWRTFEDELRKAGGALLDAFRNVSASAHEVAKLLSNEASRFQADPGAQPDSDVAEYYLDVEALRDDRRATRLWDVFYSHWLDRSSYFDVTEIFATITEAFTPARDRDGRPKARQASEIVEFVRQNLEARAQDTYRRALVDLKIDLARALELEARYTLLVESGADLAALAKSGKLDEAVDRVPEDRVRTFVSDKIARVRAECAVLAHFDQATLGGAQNEGVTPAFIELYGLAKKFSTDEPGSLERTVRSVVEATQRIDGWEDEDSLVLYRAVLGVPIYFFKNVRSVLEPAYEKVRRDPARSFPLHIEASWEPWGEAAGLPNLDPLALKRAREAEVAQREAERRRGARAQLVREFTMASFAGRVAKDGGVYAWRVDDASKALGKDRAAALAAFEALDPDLRKLLVEPALLQWRDSLAEKPSRARLRGEYEAHLSRLKGLMAIAAAEEREAEHKAIKEELAVVESMLAELGPATS